MALIDEFLQMAASRKASDIHFSAGEPIRMRIDGDLVAVTDRPYTDEELTTMLTELMDEGEQQKFVTSRNLDKSYALENVGFFRVNIFKTRRGIAAVLRTIPQKIPSMADLSLPDAARVLAESPKGLVLVTGPTGSGKSTTLAAMIDHINANCPYHILTAEDPVEFVHPSKMSLINQREIGASCATFADALKYALREDPDVILVGEMRDLETIGLALTAAETGHLVFGTLHTRGAGASVDRIIDSFPANQQAMIRTMLSESLVGVISQSLLKKKDGTGRVAAFEILLVNHAISNLIREGKTFQMTSIIQTGRKDGMQLMDQHIIELVDKGIVDPLEAEPYMEDASAIQSRIGARPAKAPALGNAPKPATAGAPPSLGKPPTLGAPAAAPKAATAAPTKAPAFQPLKAPPAATPPTPAPAAPATIKPAPAAKAPTPKLTVVPNPAPAPAPVPTPAAPPIPSAAAPAPEPKVDFEATEDELSEGLELEATNTNIESSEMGNLSLDETGEHEPLESEATSGGEELLSLPVADEAFDTKIVDRDEMPTSEVTIPKPAAKATLAKPAAPAAVSTPAKAAPPPNLKTPPPPKPAAPVGGKLPPPPALKKKAG